MTAVPAAPDDVIADVFGAEAARARAYAEILGGRGAEWGLIGPRELDRLWERHLFNSVAHAELFPEGAEVVDVGSGAGLPGIPLALARPDLRVTLLEPLERRAEFLTLAVSELGLGERVRVVRERAEDHREKYDVVTCRAVAPMAKLLRAVWSLRRADGVVLALKGASVDQELVKARGEISARKARLDVRQVRAHPATEVTTVVCLSR